MFNPTNLDEVCVQAKYLEERGKQSVDEKVIVSLSMRVKERASLMEEQREISLSKKRKRNSHVNIVRRMAMMKTIVGNSINS